MIFATLLAVGYGDLAAQLPTPDAKTCKLLSTDAIESALGTAVTRQAGTDSDRYSSCTYSAGASASAKLEIHAPGQAGLPTSVAMGLEFAKATIAEAMENFETEALGNVGCYRGTLRLDELGAINTTTCFIPSGYFVLTLGRSDELVPTAAVKELLEAVAEAR